MSSKNTIFFWALPIALISISLIFQLLGLTETLRYERNPIESGEWWRFISGNFVHLGWPHSLLNAAGLIMVWLFFGNDYTQTEWSGITLTCALGVTMGLFLLNSHVVWYVGLSGLLHGLFIAGGIKVFKDEPLFSGLLLVVFALKLAYEQIAGSLPGTSDIAGGPVLVDSHLYGAITGLTIGLILSIWDAFKR